MSSKSQRQPKSKLKAIQGYFLEVIPSSAADFAFGVMGIPMALASQKIASSVSKWDLLITSLLLVFALFIQFGIAMVISVSALKDEDIQQNTLLGLGFSMAIFGIALILISAFPSDLQPESLFDATHIIMLFGSCAIILMTSIAGGFLLNRKPDRCKNDIGVILVGIMFSTILVLVAGIINRRT